MAFLEQHTGTKEEKKKKNKIQSLAVKAMFVPLKVEHFLKNKIICYLVLDVPFAQVTLK